MVQKDKAEHCVLRLSLIFILQENEIILSNEMGEISEYEQPLRLLTFLHLSFTFTLNLGILIFLCFTGFRHVLLKGMVIVYWMCYSKFS